MKEIMKAAVMASTLGLLAGQGIEDGWLRSAKRVRENKKFTRFDQERIDKAKEKRARKAAKRRSLA